MTRPSSPRSPAARAPAADWWRSRWILPAVTVGLGGVIGTRAMASTGTVFVLLLTGLIVFELVRGNDPSPYTYLMAVGGAS